MADQSAQAAPVGNAQATPAPTGNPSSQKFKVGHKVRVVSKGSVIYGHEIGTVGEIVSFSLDGVPSVRADNMSLYHSPSSLEPAAYIPAVGDVVEHDEFYGDTEGICFNPKGWVETISIACKSGSWCSSMPPGLKKVGECAGLKETETEVGSALKIAKAYFSKQQEPTFTPDPDKSYKDNQAAWVKFHGIKVGSKVKVVRKAKDYEDGYPYKYNTEKDKYIGKIKKISSIDSDSIILDSSFCFPYFVLEPVQE